MDMSRERRLAAIPGVGPRLTSPPTACVFAPRCAHRMPACEVRPTLGPQGEAHQVACWLHAPAGSA
jgi:oligopeptide/dipeptide ABC transporter ATP-binding protein